MSKKTTSSQTNVKLRHSTGAYLHMHDAPTEEDMVFFLSSQKHKAADMAAIVKAFGEQKADAIEAIIRVLLTKMKISRDNDILTLIKS